MDKHLGSQMAGLLGMNLHVANALAALYLALGQDVACVAENAIGIATYENAVKICTPRQHAELTVGTVGGATRLNAQHGNAVGGLRWRQYSRVNWRRLFAPRHWHWRFHWRARLSATSLLRPTRNLGDKVVDLSGQAEASRAGPGIRVPEA